MLQRLGRRYKSKQAHGQAGWRREEQTVAAILGEDCVVRTRVWTAQECFQLGPEIWAGEDCPVSQILLGAGGSAIANKGGQEELGGPRAGLERTFPGQK